MSILCERLLCKVPVLEGSTLVGHAVYKNLWLLIYKGQNGDLRSFIYNMEKNNIMEII